MPISTRQATIAVDNCDDILILGEPPPYDFAKRLGDPLGGCEIACLPFREVGRRQPASVLRNEVIDVDMRTGRRSLAR